MTGIDTPIYLLTTEAACWKCHRPQTVGALAGARTDVNGRQTRLILYYIRVLPAEVLDLITARLPWYRVHFSATTRSEYYTNMCECGANFGDFFLYSEPGEGFWATSEDEARAIAIKELPLSGKFDIEADGETGGLDLLFEYGKQIES